MGIFRYSKWNGLRGWGIRLELAYVETLMRMAKQYGVSKLTMNDLSLEFGREIPPEPRPHPIIPELEEPKDFTFLASGMEPVPVPEKGV